MSEWEQAEQRVRVLVVGFLTLLLAFALVMELGAEESEIIPLGESGLSKSDLSPVLYLCEEGSACVSEPTTSITLVAQPNGIHYRWENLPDVESGTGTYRAVVWDHDGVFGVYSWPNTTRTPQSLIAAVAHRVSISPLELAVGSTFPPIATTIHGLTSDPTGSTATFTMWSRSSTPLLDDVSATCDDVDAHTDGTWSLTCKHEWTALETADPCLDCKGRFTVTLPGGEILGSPPSPNELRIVIHR